MGKSKKGGAFERETCGLLSLWWSHGKHDDLFWRTAGSGGRATVRMKRGKRTLGHAGDICATSKSGKRLLRVVTLELKRGYNKSTLHDVLDAPMTAAEQVYVEWIKQARDSARMAKTPFWWLIARRDRRKPMLFFPESMLSKLSQMPQPIVKFYVFITEEDTTERIDVCGVPLNRLWRAKKLVEEIRCLAK
jgi:hypothetical protein